MLVKERFMKLKAVSLIAAMLALKVAATAAQTYNWTTVAGTASYGAADGTNSTARFNFPSSVAVDSSGNVYLTDTSNHTIRKLAPEGTNWVVTTIAGRAQWSGSADGDNSEARFYKPSALAVDTEGSLYVTDAGNNTIRKLTPVDTNWVVSTVAGLAGKFGIADGIGDAARFNGPSGIAVDPNGIVYVSDTSNNTIRMLTPMGTSWMVSTIGGTFGFGGGFFQPKGIVADKSGNVYVAEGTAIRKLTPSMAQWMVITISEVHLFVHDARR